MAVAVAADAASSVRRRMSIKSSLFP